MPSQAAPQRAPGARPATQSVTFRAIAVGSVTVALTCVASAYLEFKSKSAHMAMSNLPMTALLPFVWWLLVNSLLKRFAPRWSLTGMDLLVIFSMTWVGGSFAGYTWITQWVGRMAAPHYYASPENRWAELFFDYLPWWMYPSDSGSAIRHFFNGLPPGANTPWGVWLLPFFWVASIALALLLTGLAITVLFQKQWEENERLSFPLAAVPLALTSDFDRRPGWPWFFRNRAFWFGAGVASLPLLWNMAGYFVLNFPHLGIFDTYFNAHGSRYAYLFRFLRPMSYRILPTIVGFAFLCDLDILFSLWFFKLIGWVVEYAMWSTGFAIGLSGQTADPRGIGGLQAHGALTFLVAWSLWISRKHLRDVFRQALSRTASDRAPTLMSYRTALLVLALSLGYSIFWCHWAGFDLWVACAWVLLMWAGLFAMMKYLAASGFAYMFPGWGTGMPEVFLGSSGMTDSTLVAYRVINPSLIGGWRTAPALPHALRVSHGASGVPRLLGAVLIAFAVGIGVSFIYTLSICYQEGGTSFRTWSLVGGAQTPYNRAASIMTETVRTVPDPQKAAVWASGIALAAVLSVLRTRLPWWPLHPIGVIFQFDWFLGLYTLTIFITYLIKLIILRFGGIILYRRALPFFYGLIVGFVFALGVSFLVDVVWFPGLGQGHYVHGF